MSHFGLKISKSESPDKTPYTVYYPHSIPSTERKWIQPYYQVISIDPARKNYGFRIERRYHNGWITPIVFDKTAVESFEQEGDTIICNTYQVLTAFLTKYEQFYDDCHFIIIERQLPQNYKASRIAQHTISYFSIRTHNKPLLPSIIEIDPKLKGKILGAPKGTTDKQLKTWAIEKARELLSIRKDDFSLQVLDHFRNKQDDLSDTVCQAEALFICWGLQPTCPPPTSSPDDTLVSVIRPITLSLTPSIVISNIDDIVSMIHPINTQSIKNNTIVPVPSVDISSFQNKGSHTQSISYKIQSTKQIEDTKAVACPKRHEVSPGGRSAGSFTNTVNLRSNPENILSFVQTAPIRAPATPISLNCVLPREVKALQIENVQIENVQIENVQIENVQIENVQIENVQIEKVPVDSSNLPNIPVLPGIHNLLNTNSMAATTNNNIGNKFQSDNPVRQMPITLTILK
jgi:hypothetical protein